MSAITAETLKKLGQQAFAMAILETRSDVCPNAEKVEFIPGILDHKCSYSTGEGLIFEGIFYQREPQDYNNGVVCITMVQDQNRFQYSYPHSWHYLFGIND